MTMYSSGSYPWFKTDSIVSSRNLPWLNEGVMMLSFKAIGSLRLKAFDRVDDVNLLRLAQLRIRRQRKRLRRRALRFRECSFFVAKIRKTLLPVQRDRIIDFRTDAAFAQVVHERVAMTRNTNHVLVEDVAATGPHKRRHYFETQIGFTQQLRVKRRFLNALVRPRIEARQLHVQHRCLQLVQPAVDADFRVLIFGNAAVRAQSF